MSGPHKGSLGAKLFHLQVGETIYLTDVKDSEVMARVFRAPYLAGRKFQTGRRDVIEGRILVPVLRVTRTV